MKVWMQQIPAAELATYEKAGFSGTLAFGKAPALIVVDVTLGFTGAEGLTLEEAIAQFSTACGPSSWVAMPRIARLIELFRAHAAPIVYTRSNLGDTRYTGRATKSKRANAAPPGFNDFPAAIAPRDGEWVLEKSKASAFFGTPLATYLVQQGIDTTVLCGVSTSGCVRASVVDAFSHGFTTFLVDDCCFDRSEFAHAANLFDMHGKYAAVLSLEEIAPLVMPTGAGRRAAAE